VIEIRDRQGECPDCVDTGIAHAPSARRKDNAACRDEAGRGHRAVTWLAAENEDVAEVHRLEVVDHRTVDDHAGVGIYLL
jgi:hypothetical protein